MSESNFGIGTTDGDISMTTQIEELAAYLIGDPTDDPSQDALRDAILRSAANVAEIGETGFGTTVRFDHDYLTAHIASQVPFTVDSVRGATYLVGCLRRQGDVYRVAVQVYDPDPRTVSNQYYRMTLVRTEDGSIR